MLRVLVNVLIRQAIINNENDPRQWLIDLQTTKWTDVNAQNGQIVGTSVNGKSVTLASLPGTTIADLLFATEYAINLLDAGFTFAPGTVAVNTR